MELPHRAPATLAPTAPTVAVAPLRIGMLIASTNAAGGGVSVALQSLTRALEQRPETRVEIFSLSEPERDDAASWGGATLIHHQVRGPRSFSYAPALDRSLADRPVDLVHLHGIWMYCSVAARRWASRSGGPCLISPHGMLDPWALANSAWKKWIARRLFEDDNLRNAACLHALCEAELRAIRDFGLRNPVCVVPNGVDPPPPAPLAVPAWRQALPPKALVLLYLGRLHPKKALLELVEAWRLAEQSRRAASGGWHLVVAGTGSNDYVRSLQARIAQLGLGDTVHLIGPQFGSAKATTFAAADAFVLPSFSEGLPMAALEAWACGLPALLTSPCNLPEGFAAGAALRLEVGAEGIAAGLRTLFTLPAEQRYAMGRLGRELAAERFAWRRVAAEFDSVYRWMLGTTGRPACVEIA